MELLNLLTAFLPLGVVVIAYYLLAVKPKKAFNLYEDQLRGTGFNIAKRISTKDFYSKWHGVINPYIGVWMDYGAKKIAIRAGSHEKTPKIYNFSDLKHVEVEVGPSGPIWVYEAGIPIFQKKVQVMQAPYRTMTLRIQTGTYDVSSILLHLWKITALSRNEDANSRKYQAVIEGCKNMEYEIRNIIEKS